MVELNIRPDEFSRVHVREILVAFGLHDGTSLDILPIPQGFGRAIVRVHHGNHDLVIKQHDVRQQPERTRYTLRYHRHLYESGIACPRLHRTPAGELLAVVNGAGYSVQDCIPGERVDVDAVDPDTRLRYRRQIGQLLGHVHAAGTPDLARQAPQDCHRPADQLFSRLPPVYERLPWSNAGKLGHAAWFLLNERGEFGRELRRALPRLESARQHLMASSLASAPQLADLHPVHGDFHFDNVLFEGERITGLIDFGNAGLTPALFDVGSTMAVVCSEREHEDEFVAAYLQGPGRHSIDPEILRTSALLRIVKSLLYQIPLYTNRRVRLHAKARQWITRLLRMLEIEYSTG